MQLNAVKFLVLLAVLATPVASQSNNEANAAAFCADAGADCTRDPVCSKCVEGYEGDDVTPSGNIDCAGNMQMYQKNFPATPECKLDIGYSALSTTIGCIINYGFYTSGAASPCLNAACLPQINACKANDACWECETSVADTLEYYDLIDGSCENRLANIEQFFSESCLKNLRSGLLGQLNRCKLNFWFDGLRAFYTFPNCALDETPSPAPTLAEETPLPSPAPTLADKTASPVSVAADETPSPAPATEATPRPTPVPTASAARPRSFRISSYLSILVTVLLLYLS